MVNSPITNVVIGDESYDFGVEDIILLVRTIVEHLVGHMIW